MVPLTGDHVPGGLELPSEHVLDGACPLLPGAQWSPDSDHVSPPHAVPGHVIPTLASQCNVVRVYLQFN